MSRTTEERPSGGTSKRTLFKNAALALAGSALGQPLLPRRARAQHEQQSAPGLVYASWMHGHRA